MGHWHAGTWSPDTDDLATYLTAEWGRDLAVEPDGSTFPIERSCTLHADDAPVVRVRCPGLNNVESPWWTEDFVEWPDDSMGYITIEPQPDPGRFVGTLADVIRECCEDGDVAEHLDELGRLVDDALLRLDDTSGFPLVLGGRGARRLVVPEELHGRLVESAETAPTQDRTSVAAHAKCLLLSAGCDLRTEKNGGTPAWRLRVALDVALRGGGR